MRKLQSINRKKKVERRAMTKEFAPEYLVRDPRFAELDELIESGARPDRALHLLLNPVRHRREKQLPKKSL